MSTQADMHTDPRPSVVTNAGHVPHQRRPGRYRMLPRQVQAFLPSSALFLHDTGSPPHSLSLKLKDGQSVCAPAGRRSQAGWAPAPRAAPPRTAAACQGSAPAQRAAPALQDSRPGPARPAAGVCPPAPGQPVHLRQGTERETGAISAVPPSCGVHRE